ncbi:MAG: hypothetical protein RLZZ282_154 [Verrucomicrobiota bacterium]
MTGFPFFELLWRRGGENNAEITARNRDGTYRLTQPGFRDNHRRPRIVIRGLVPAVVRGLSRCRERSVPLS